jgi:fatty-acyl-CoA synthase
MGTMADLVAGLAASEHPGLRFEDQQLTHAEVVAAASARAAWLLDQPPSPHFHVGVLLDNVPETLFWLEACALAGAALVGLNSTRPGPALVADLAHTDCQVLVTDTDHLSSLASLSVPAGVQTLVIDDPAYDATLDPYRSAGLPSLAVKESDIFLLIFTSGTTSAPKAVIRSQGVFARFSERVARGLSITQQDVAYNSMPWFHSNALYVAYGPVIATGATLALRRRFSASAFAADVRTFGATYFNYVGKPLEYILATPLLDSDRDNWLRFGQGNEANEGDIAAFEARFGCRIFDGFGSSENAITIVRTPNAPVGSLGQAAPGVIVANPETGEECPRAEFDGSGHLVNADFAIGELVNTTGGNDFEGYYANDEANASRIRNGWYWSGDLGYRDADGFFYFAGRGYDWLRVDGENFAAAPIERILLRHPDVLLTAVYAVPDPHVGDRVMAALELRAGAVFDPASFAAFLAAQPDLGVKWAPHFIRLCAPLPLSPTNKIMKRELRAEAWETTDPVWERVGRRSFGYARFTGGPIPAG